MAGVSNFQASSVLCSAAGGQECSQPFCPAALHRCTRSLGGTWEGFPALKSPFLVSPGAEAGTAGFAEPCSPAGHGLEGEAPSVEGITWAVGMVTWVLMGWNEELLLELQKSGGKKKSETLNYSPENTVLQ